MTERTARGFKDQFILAGEKIERDARLAAEKIERDARLLSILERIALALEKQVKP